MSFRFAGLPVRAGPPAADSEAVSTHQLRAIDSHWSTSPGVLSNTPSVLTPRTRAFLPFCVQAGGAFPNAVHSLRFLCRSPDAATGHPPVVDFRQTFPRRGISIDWPDSPGTKHTHSCLGSKRPVVPEHLLFNLLPPTSQSAGKSFESPSRGFLSKLHTLFASRFPNVRINGFVRVPSS